MAKPYIVTAIDLGTGNIKGMQVYWRGKGAEPEVLSLAQATSGGIRKGVVENKEAVAEKVRLILDELYRMSQRRANGVVVNICGGHLFTVSSQGVVVVSGPDQKITQGDMDRALVAAQAISLPPNKEILEVWPKSFAVDQERGIKEPLGMKGIRIEAEVLALCGLSPYVRNVYDAISLSGTQVLDAVPSPLAAAKSVLSAAHKELGCAVVDIGARTTNLTVFEDGELLHAAVFPIGSANITDDIAIALRIDRDSAEKIKTEFGIPLARKRGSAVGKAAALPRIKRMDQKAAKTKFRKASFSKGKDGMRAKRKAGRIFEVETASGQFAFHPTILNRVIEARLRDIFEEVNKELKRVSRQELLPAGVVLTGGGANLKNLVEIAKRELRLPCQIGLPQSINGAQDDPALSAVCGLTLEALESGNASGGFSAGNVTNKIRGFFRMFIP